MLVCCRALFSTSSVNSTANFASRSNACVWRCPTYFSPHTRKATTRSMCTTAHRVAMADVEEAHTEDQADGTTATRERYLWAQTHANTSSILCRRLRTAMAAGVAFSLPYSSPYLTTAGRNTPPRRWRPLQTRPFTHAVAPCAHVLILTIYKMAIIVLQ